MKYYTGSWQLNGVSTIPEGQLLVIYLDAGYQLGGLSKCFPLCPPGRMSLFTSWLDYEGAGEGKEAETQPMILKLVSSSDERFGEKGDARAHYLTGKCTD